MKVVCSDDQYVDEVRWISERGGEPLWLHNADESYGYEGYKANAQFDLLVAQPSEG